MPEQFKVNTNEYLQQCHDKDVISFNNKTWLNINKIRDIIYQSFYSTGIGSIVTHIANKSELKDTNKTCSWFHSGQECEILRAGSKGWQKGKIKKNVTLEFIPDEPEETASPLDDVRQELEQK